MHRLIPVIIVGAVFLAYSNTFHVAWQLDDYSYFLDGGSSLHWESIDLNTISNTFFPEGGGGTRSRPVAALTLAINWYLGQDNVVTYHLFNLAIHIFAALLLFNVFRQLYQTPTLSKANPPHDAVGFTILIATLLWALNPVQTQAVTYIVQRMASLATLFYLAGIYCYLRYRLSYLKSNKSLWIFGLVICFLLALGSKQIAVTLPVSIFLIELFFFRDEKRWYQRHIRSILSLLVLTVFSIFVAIYILGSPDLSIFQAYAERSFSLQERLLTEARIVVWYLSLLFYPIPSRLSIAHDIVLSSSLFTPLTTILAVIFIASLICLAITLVRNKPIFSFAILFFFLNHLIESTALPLELIFEHRNYLPSTFLFWPLVSFLTQSAFSPKAPVFFRSLLNTSLVVLVALLAWSTFQRNQAWATQKSLWADAMIKAPGEARPVFYLAQAAARDGHDDIAITLYQRSLPLSAASQLKYRAYTNHQLAKLHLRRGHSALAVEHLRRATEIMPATAFFRYHLAQALTTIGEIEKAEHHLHIIIDQNKDGPLTHWLLGRISLDRGKIDQALASFASAIKAGSDDTDIVEDFILALFLSGRSQAALETLQSLSPLHRLRCGTSYLDAVLHYESGDEQLLSQRMDNLLSFCPIIEVVDEIKRFDGLGASGEAYEHARTTLVEKLTTVRFSSR